VIFTDEIQTIKRPKTILKENKSKIKKWSFVD